jgi:hypothetical protein
MNRSTIPNTPHTFHIPVMGLGYTIDTPVKVAHFGISSVVSIIEDELVERMREFHCRQAGEAYAPIPKPELDHRALRITAYLDLLQRIVDRNVETLRQAPLNRVRTLPSISKCCRKATWRRRCMIR